MCIFFPSLLALRLFVSLYQPQSWLDLDECVDWSKMTKNLNYFDGLGFFFFLFFTYVKRYNIIYHCVANDSILIQWAVLWPYAQCAVRITISNWKFESKWTMHKLISLSNENQQLPRNYPFNDDLLLSA